MNHRLKSPALLAVSALALAGCATASPAPDVDAIRYDSPPFSGTAFADCVKAGGYQMAPPWAGAAFFDYPAGQRTYTFSGDGKGSDASDDRRRARAEVERLRAERMPLVQDRRRDDDR